MSDFPQLQIDAPRVRLDGRAHLRDRHYPETVTVVRVDGPLNALINKAIEARPTPVALVAVDASALVLTAGGSGVIWVQGERTAQQEQTVASITAALQKLGARVDAPTPPADPTPVAPKSTRKKKTGPVDEPDVPAEELTVDQPATEEIPIVEFHLPSEDNDD